MSAKEAVGKAAAELISPGMTIGLGTGSTANAFIVALGERCRAGLSVHGVCTSKASEELALKNGIPIIPLDEIKQLDLCVDGADEVNPSKQLIKGGGGALLREKIVACAGKEMVVIVDESKLVDSLGKFPLPVEIVPFGVQTTLRQINDLGLQGSLRKNKEGGLYLTDNGNYLIDLTELYPIKDPYLLDQSLKEIPGIVETGLFLDIAGRVLVGHADGTVTIIQ